MRACSCCSCSPPLEWSFTWNSASIKTAKSSHWMCLNEHTINIGSNGNLQHLKSVESEWLFTGHVNTCPWLRSTNLSDKFHIPRRVYENICFWNVDEIGRTVFVRGHFLQLHVAMTCQLFLSICTLYPVASICKTNALLQFKLSLIAWSKCFRLGTTR